MRSLITLFLILFVFGCNPEKKSRSKIEALEHVGESQKYALGVACMEYISQHGNNLPWSKILVRKLIAAGFYPEAIYGVELLLKKFPGEPELLLLRSTAYRNLHQYGLAMEDLQHGLKLQPGNDNLSQEVTALNNEHELWKEIERLNQSLRGSPDSFPILLNRAEDFFKMRQYDAVLYDLGSLSKMRSPEDSIYYTEKVIALYKDNRRPVDMLAEMLEYFGRK
ncbi:MAG: hypothetical protein WEB30_09760 [Cyclobacteriaceae bacterium]